MNAIFNRRSVRSFLEKEVEKDKVEKLLRAAMQAPSAYNQQAWKFIVVKGKENLAKLASCNQYAGSLNKANLGIVVLGVKSQMKMPQYWQQDLGAATQNIILEAVELGLGSVWYGTAPDEEKMSYIKNLYNLSDDLLPYSVIGVGYPKLDDANHFVDRFNADNVQYID